MKLKGICCSMGGDNLNQLSSLPKQPIISVILFFSFLFFFFLGPNPWHMEVPRLGVESGSYRCWPQPNQQRIQAESLTYTTAHGNTRSPTH